MPAKPVISIVDDDETAREGTLDLVKSMGFAVRAFRSAEEFLKSNHLGSTSCLITDMRMPGMNGLELHSRLLESGHSIPAILITAFPNNADRSRALRAGVKCYLPKPFDDEELLACVRSAIESRGAERSGRKP